MESIIKQIKKPVIDILINIISNGLPTIFLQVVVYPLVALRLGATRNDLFLVFMSVVHILVAATSGSLCNTRLLLNQEYEKEKIKGDFNIILLGFGIVNAVVLTIVSFLYSDASIGNLLQVILLGLLWMVRDYLIVEFRLNLNFFGILYNNLVLVAGIICGILCFNYVDQDWRIIFIIAYSFALIHIIFKTKLWKEPIKKTILFPKTGKKSLVLACSTGIGLIPSTCSSLFVYQIGNTWVSIYTSALIIGKILTMVSSPLSSVLISYIVRIKKLSTRHYLFCVVGIVSLGIIGYFGCVSVAKPILSLLYPLWADAALKLIPITVGIAILDLLSTLLNPIILHFGNEKWQLIIQISYSLLYFVLGLIAVNLGSIQLFAGLNFALSLLRFIFMIWLGRKIVEE